MNNHAYDYDRAERDSIMCNLADVDDAETCPECKEGLMLSGGWTIENSDADGRRGIKTRWFCCDECGYEEGRFE